MGTLRSRDLSWPVTSFKFAEGPIVKFGVGANNNLHMQQWWNCINLHNAYFRRLWKYI